jgi:cytochrome c oxidase cbb3-type subunit III
MNRAAVSIGLFLMVCSFGCLQAQESAGVRQQQQTTSERKAAGQREFRQTCGFCHGPDGRGASGPDLIRSALVSHDVNGNLLGPVVRNGRPEKGMPAFPLPEDTIRAIAEFLHAEVRLASSVSQRVPTEYPLEKLLVGSAAAGKTYFEGPGRCVECHSVTGDLAHIASKYKPIDLQTRIAFPSGPAPNVKVTEPSGQVIAGVETYSDEFLISVRDRYGWVRTWNRNAVKVDIQDPLAAHVALLNQYSDANIHDLFAYMETLK